MKKVDEQNAPERKRVLAKLVITKKSKSEKPEGETDGPGRKPKNY